MIISVLYYVLLAASLGMFFHSTFFWSLHLNYPLTDRHEIRGIIVDYQCGEQISDIDWLKCVLIDCWTKQSQDTLNQEIDKLQKWLLMVISAKCAYVEVYLDTFCVQMIVAVTFTVCSS